MVDNLEQTPKESTKNNRANDKAKPRSTVNVVLLLLVIIALFITAGLGWKGFELYQQVAVLHQQQQQSIEQKNTLVTQLKDIQTQSSLLAQQFKHNGERLAQLPGADQNDWLLAEAEYLLRLANQRLNLEKDWQGAKAILETADSVLAETKNPLLRHVRLALANELQQLRAVPAVDITGAVARLQAVQNQISELEWMPRALPKAVAVVATPVTEETPSAWQTFADKAWAGLGVIVRVRHHDEALPAPLTPDQHYYLQQNMHLMLEQAQVALVRQHDALYKQSIQRTQDWLNEFVMLETAESAAVKETLTELKEWNVSPVVPEISGSLILLRKLLAQQRGNASPSSQTTETK